MRVLILGGTVFLSRATAAEAVGRGHQVTCLARGQSGSVPPGAQLVRADRSGGPATYDELTGEWDEVVDVSWDPTHVREAVAALGPRSAHWTYVSSCSVYADHDQPGADESAPLLEPLGDQSATIERYGEAKVACEQAVTAALGDRALRCRAGLIGGPGDPSDRFGYWPARFARDAEPVLAPDAPDCATQTIDVRDLAAWLVGAAERGVAGARNAVGETIPLPEVVALARAAAGHRGPLVAADPAWLMQQGVEPWAGPDSLPLWLPPDAGYGAFARRSVDAALADVLHRRPLSETLADTLADERRAGLSRPRRAGLSPERERQLVAAWRARRAEP